MPPQEGRAVFLAVRLTRKDAIKRSQGYTKRGRETTRAAPGSSRLIQNGSSVTE